MRSHRSRNLVDTLETDYTRVLHGNLMGKRNRNPYTPIEKIAEGLHCVSGYYGRSPMGRRMTVMHVGEDTLAIHSAIRMNDPDMRQLDELGRVAYVIAPNPLHASEAPWYAERYPQAKVLVPKGMRRRQEKRMRIDGTVENGWPPELLGRLEALLVDGLRIPETAFLHVRSRTLVVTDLVMNFGPDHFKGMVRSLMKLNGIVGRFGPSRLFRCAIKSKVELNTSLNRILIWDFDRIVMNHGRVLETGGRDLLRRSFEFLESHR